MRYSGVVGDADTDGFVGVEIVARHVAVGVHDEGVGAGQAAFEQAEEVFVHGSDILGGHAE